MSRRRRPHPTIMTIDDHGAAARELATVHRGVTDFENVIYKSFEDGRRIDSSIRAMMGRIHRYLKTIHEALDKIQTEMREVQACTLPGEAQADLYWREIETMVPIGTVPRAATVPSLDDHIAAARALGTASSATSRWLQIVRYRRQRPARILHMAIRIQNLIHLIRCALDGIQFLTLPPDSVDCWIGPYNPSTFKRMPTYFDSDEDANANEATRNLEVPK